MPNITTNHAITHTNMPRRYQIDIAKLFYSYRDDLPEILEKKPLLKNTKSTLPVDIRHSKTFINKLLDNLIRNGCYSCTQATLRGELYKITTDCCLHSVKPEVNCRLLIFKFI